MSMERTYSGGAESLSGGAEAPLAVAADRPDAAPKAGDDGVRIVCHALALVLVLALVAYCVVWAPRGAGGGRVRWEGNGSQASWLNGDTAGRAGHGTKGEGRVGGGV